MNYPAPLKIGDTIGICAPSGGIAEEKSIKKLEAAIIQLKEMGYQIIETEHVRTETRGRSSSAKQRAKEFMELLENDKVKLIIFATGGDFLVEILEELDIEKIKKLPPKWLQGYSDITGIGFLWNTLLDIPTMHFQTIKDYAMRPICRNLTNALKLEAGEKVIQASFEQYEVENKSEKVDAPYNLTKPVEWKNITGEKNIIMEGRSLGGCLDVLKNLFGTKYDHISSYLERHKEDGFIWFLECFEMSTPQVYTTLWQMKNSGYFNDCKGIIFGRPLFIRNDYDITFNEAVLNAIGTLNIPIITDADIGHVSPQLAIINGAKLKITSENGRGTVETYFN